ncbi:MAG: hypothetical protein O3C40_09605 [Planctomycetota bacterium]|nr:hypothetical protein [Planctomycetota bacterium]
MTDSEPVALAAPGIAPLHRRKFLQWNIATLLLLMAVVGVWTAYFRMKSEAVRMDAELDSLRELARELLVNDPSQYAIVERHEEWYGDHVWDVHLPEGDLYVLKLATGEIDPKIFPETEHMVDLAAGQHIISLEKTLRGDHLSARAISDGRLAMHVSESGDWIPSGVGAWGRYYNRSTQAPCDKPLEVIRLYFRKHVPPGTGMEPDEPYNGVFLWIERKP